MRNWRTFISIPLSLLLMVFGLSACDGDDDGGTPSGDTAAPLVTMIQPDGSGVALTMPVTVTFNEAMDPASADGNVTLSHGAITDLTWADASTLVISHAQWPEATEVTVTVTTGLEDQAGNALPQTWTASFWTMSSVPLVLEADPPDGQADVLLSYAPRLHFSQRMNTLSVQNNTIITEDPLLKAVPQFSITELEDYWYRIDFEGDLTANTIYTVTVGADAQVYGGSETLGTDYATDFTTGDQTDEEPPYILSTVPALDATVNPDVSALVITFNEPIIPGNMDPVRMAAILNLVLAGEPQLNQAGDQMTVYLEPPLPAGVRLFAVFGPGSFSDHSGNWNADEDSASFRVAGTPDYFPVRTDWFWHYYEYGGQDNPVKSPYEGEFRRYVENVSGPTFDRVTQYWDSFGGVWEGGESEYLRKNSNGYYFRGFEDDGEDIMFSPEVIYQDLPFVAGGTWDGTVSMSGGGTVEYSGRTVGQETIYLNEMMGKVRPPTKNYFEDCWKAILEHEVTVMETVVESATDTIWYAPGLGVVREYTAGMEVGEDELAHDYWSRVQLYEVEDKTR